MLTTPPPTRPYHHVITMDGHIFHDGTRQVAGRVQSRLPHAHLGFSSVRHYPLGTLRRLVFVYAATPALGEQKSRLTCPPRASDQRPLRLCSKPFSAPAERLPLPGHPRLSPVVAPHVCFEGVACGPPGAAELFTGQLALLARRYRDAPWACFAANHCRSWRLVLVRLQCPQSLRHCCFFFLF